MKKIDSAKYYFGGAIGLWGMSLALAGEENKLWPMCFLVAATLLWKLACSKWDD